MQAWLENTKEEICRWRLNDEREGVGLAPDADEDVRQAEREVSLVLRLDRLGFKQVRLTSG